MRKVSSLTIEPAETRMQSTSLLTVTILLVAVTMTFGALIFVFYNRSQVLAFWGHIELPRVLWASTVLLLVSSVTMEMGRLRLNRNLQIEAHQMFGVTSALGILFLIGQIVAWRQVLSSGVVLARNPHSWFIFLFSGLHGAHILVGLAGVVYLYTRTGTVVTGPKYLMKTRAITTGVSVFWHYLDLLWILLFGILLFWRP